MVINLMSLDEKRFEELCQSLLHEELSRFQPFSPPDQGMDGYDSDSQTVFQVYFPERAPRKDKVESDLEKAKACGLACQRWVLMLPKNPTPAFDRWLREEQQPRYAFRAEIWGKTQIGHLLQKHPKVKEMYFPSDVAKVIKRIVKGKLPRVGDAPPGEAIDAEEAFSLREMMAKLAKEEAERTRRRPDYSREYGEFNKHFKLSSYDCLPKAKLPEAQRHLEQKMHLRRRGEPQYRKAARYRNAVHAIKHKLKISDPNYQKILLGLTGKTSTADMSLKELETVYRDFRQRQGLEEAVED